MVVYLMSDKGGRITGQIYTAVGGKIAVWNQPREIRAMYTAGRWTPRGDRGPAGRDRRPGGDALLAEIVPSGGGCRRRLGHPILVTAGAAGHDR